MTQKTIYGNAVFFEEKTFLLRGDSGCGKSDLSLRMIEAGGKLIADDRIILTIDNNVINLESPYNLKGLLEVRGLGIIKIPYLDKMSLDILCDLRQNYDRMPEKRTTIFYDQLVDYYCINPFELSILPKLKLIARNQNYYE